MRKSDIRSRTASVRLLPDQNTETPRRYVFWSGLSLVWSRLESRPAFVFVLLSFVFGSAISVVVPPLRGPDEIAFCAFTPTHAGGFYQPRKSMVARESSSSTSCTPSSRSSRTQENASPE